MSADSQPAAKPTEKPRAFSFNQLIDDEFDRLDQATPGKTSPHQPPLIASPGRADEPWISFTDRDLFGLALSGGGIRSATFNLGLLQALERKQLLKNVDYLSTVSGGGYIGGFWTAWRQRADKTSGDTRHFPSQPSPSTPPGKSGLPDTREQPEIRHLREFSRFLMPRVGFFCMETWAGIVTILGGLVPSMTAAISMLALLHYAWFYLSYALITASPLWSWVWLSVLVFAYQSLCEYGWRHSGKDGNTSQNLGLFILFAATASALTGVFWLYWRTAWMCDSMDVWLHKVQQCWQAGTGRSYPVDTGFDCILFQPAVILVIAGTVLLIARAIASRFVRGNDAIRWSSIFDRAAARCFAPAVMWAAMALVWEVCHWLLHQEWKFAATTGSTVTFGVLFVWLRDWLTKPTEENLASTLFGRIAEQIKPMVPQLLAIAFVFSMLVSVGVLVQGFGLGWPFRVAIGAGSALILTLGTLIFFDPARVGMHDFYRSRICRCFLGAARAAGQSNPRPTSEQYGDDITFGELRKNTEKQRPIHLVCCAANNLAGDTLGSLYRGARSAVISPFGISLGSHAATCDNLRYSSALTASAAAFNSQMGRVSMDLGPAVAFVMSAFNLRLGLWVPHPLMRNPRTPLLAGRPFYYEMFGQTKCDPLPPDDGGELLYQKIKKRVEPLAQQLPQAAHQATRNMMNLVASKQMADVCADKAGELSAKVVGLAANRIRDVQFLHLSDGAHFENLGLYELVRRHCRYIIVSDCGTDPEVAFDDLAVALRSIREDFGVEIDLDASPLRAEDSGRARQHAVVGTIHYDGLGGTDKGTILLFKPTLTGDEPTDIIQYQVRHPAFPHESTGDQFYNEAQWESYRRLGEHAGDSVLQPLAMDPGKKQRDETQFVENVFLDATQRWYPAADRQSETFLTLTQRCADVEASLCENAPARIRAEFFPEVAAAFTPVAKAPAEQPAEEKPSLLDEEVCVVHYMMLIAQLMEDAWVAADLENQWAHPLNEGWMNYFHRWAATPSFRRWWPIISPIYNNRFRGFVQDRFGIRLKEANGTGTGAALKLVALTDPEQVKTGFAWQHWLQRHGPTNLSGMQAFNYQLTLESVPDGFKPQSVQAGFLLCQWGEDDEGAFVQWHMRHLFVPHALVGSGFVTGLLEEVIAHFQKQHAIGTGPDRLQVLLDGESTPGETDSQRDIGHRSKRVHLINFYKSRSFVMSSPVHDRKTPCLLRLKLGPPRPSG